MIIEIFSVFDSAANAFLDPFTAPTAESAIRSFRHTVNHGQNHISQFPEDYTLFHIGTFAADTGKLTAFAAPHSLGLALTFVNEKPANG